MLDESDEQPTGGDLEYQSHRAPRVEPKAQGELKSQSLRRHNWATFTLTLALALLTLRTCEKFESHLETLNKSAADGTADENTLAFMNWARGNVRVCPSCRVIIYRFAGCDHMRCRCGYSFNWREADKVAQHVRQVPIVDNLPSTLFRRTTPGGGGAAYEGISNTPFEPSLAPFAEPTRRTQGTEAACWVS